MLIGNRVKQLRKAQSMSLTELSKKSGVQIATLSRIENLRMTGTLESHMNIASALGIDITELYKDVESVAQKVDVQTAKSATDVFSHNERASYEILTNNVLSKKMMPILLKIEPNGKTNKEQNSHGSEKFIFVLEGKISIHIGEESFPLSKHNTLYFDASVEHYIVNEGKSTTKVLCAATPVAL